MFSFWATAPLQLLARPSRRSGCSLEQPEINGVGHGFISRIAGMQVVAGVVGRQELLWIVRVARGGVEVDHGIEGLAVPDPLVHRLALRLADIGVICRAIERSQ